MKNEAVLRVIVEREGNDYVAQCIDFDIAGVASTLRGAIDEFAREFIRHILVAVQLKKQDPLASIPQPPQEYRDRWYRSVGAGSVKPQGFKIPDFEIQGINYDSSWLPHSLETALVG